MSDRKKILLIAFSDSIHTARWLSQFQDGEFEFHLLPSVPFSSFHPDLSNVTIYSFSHNTALSNGRIHVKSALTSFRALEKIFGSNFSKRLAQKFAPVTIQKMALKKIMGSLQPSIVHTMETQKAGYLMSALKRNKQPIHSKWIHSTWGIDLHFFDEHPEHRGRISKVLNGVDLLITEGERDIRLARKLGYKGETAVMPSVGGGIDMDLFDSIDRKYPATRDLILLKGYDGHERLASMALNALRQIKKKLNPFTVVVYSCSRNLFPLIEEIKRNTEFKIEVKQELSYIDILRLTAKARISITNNLSDGVPNTMLEAMALGAFPIQSNTAITEGLINDGENGLLTNPTDVNNIAMAIGRAIEDDSLVNHAADCNLKIIREKLDKKMLKKEILGIYHIH